MNKVPGSILGGLLMAAALILPSGCEERDPLWDRALRVEGPLVSGEHLVWLDSTTSRLVVVDTKSESAAQRIGLLPRPRSMAIAGARVVVTGGMGSEPVLELVDLNEDYEVDRVELEEAYDRVFVAPGDRHVVLIHSMDAGSSGGPAARNLNRVAVVDITGEPKVRELLLETESLAPREVVFSSDGRLAAVVLDSAIALVDLEDPSRLVRVPLRLPGGQRLLPRQVLFSPRADYLYVRASGTPDLLVLEISDAAVLMATVNFLFVPGALALEAIVVPQEEGLESHVAALFRRAGDSVAALLHASGDGSLFSQALLSKRATRLTDLGDGCMLVHGAPGSNGFSRWIAGWEIESGRVDEREVQGEYEAEPVVAGGRAYFRHDSVFVADGGAMPALTGVHVDREGAWLRVRPSAVVLLGRSTADLAGSDGTYFLGVNIAREESGAAADLSGRMSGQTGALVTITGEAMSIGGLVLDDSVTGLGLVGDHLYALHDRDLGDLTLIPLDDLSREAARRYDGLLLAGLLETMEER